MQLISRPEINKKSSAVKMEEIRIGLHEVAADKLIVKMIKV
jgi:hypothetical protein